MSRIGADLTLDQIDDWFKIGKSVAKVQTVPRSKTGGRELGPSMQPIVGASMPFVPPYKRHTRVNNPNQTRYAEHYSKIETEQITKPQPPDPFPGLPGSNFHRGLEDLELDSTVQGSVAMLEDTMPANATSVYSQYNFAHTYDSKLPIIKFRDEVVATIESNQVTVIQGSTGSGKTTQVPQFILDHYAKQNKYCNIVVTQPRRIAAMSIARRVCSERQWELGTLCGYQVGMDRTGSEDTRLLYVTTGVLLQKLINSKNMFEYTHVILDEVHERDSDSDFCLLVVRKLLRTNSRHVKVILMSATFDSDMFARYFALPVLGKLEQAPVVCVEGKAYTVSEYYLEDLKTLGELPYLEYDNPCITDEARMLCKKLIERFDNLEIQEQGKAPDGSDRFAQKRGCVLIFLPGLAEINALDELLQPLTLSHRLKIIPLHSSITSEEQYRVFEPPNPGFRKIILSTNIAESSITVPDIKYVIDFCLTKNLVCDPDTNYTSLQVEWASKANGTQRKGRAGRVSNGRVYRMVTRRFWAEYMKEYGTPEMQRCPLDQLILHVKVLDLGEPKAILGLALSPPNLDDIEKTILFLKEVGALASLQSGAVNPHDGELTFVGKVLACLPLDIRLGKLIVLGHVFGLLEECVIIAAALSLKTFFSRPYKAHLEAYRHQLIWADGSFSDCIAYLTAYKVWDNNKKSGAFQRANYSEKQFCKVSMIQLRRIREVSELVKDLFQRIGNYNIRPPPPRHQRRKNEAEDRLILKVVLAGAFYPNFFINEQCDEQEALRMMSGKDPFNTVMIKNLPANQGPLYQKDIQRIFECCGSVPKIHFEETRAFLEFKNPNAAATGKQRINTSTYHPAVYLALKMKSLRVPLEISLFDAEDARMRMKQLQNLQDRKSLENKRLRTNRVKAVSDMHASHLDDSMTCDIRQVDLPSPYQTTVPIYVSEVIDCGHFWAYYGDPDTSQTLNNMQGYINRAGGRNLRPLTRELYVGMTCIAPYEDSSVEFYRARIDAVYPLTNKQGPGDQEVQIFFLDYGNTETIAKHLLREMDDDLRTVPCQAFECFLSGIRPSGMKNPGGTWSDKAKNFFVRVVSEKMLYARIYSVVKGALRVELIEKKANGRETNINRLLYEQEFADQAEESFLSKQSHQRREEASLKNPIDATNTEIHHDEWFELPDTESSKLHRGRMKKQLSGPHTPYDMKFYSMTNIGRLRCARIDRESVNSVILNDEPQDKHDRMLVASFVGLNPTGNTMMCRDTTLMPSIHGLPALLALLFAPSAELRTDPQKKHLIGALCGLGWDEETGGPALPDHDMEVTFDTRIDLDDICKINGVKMAINIAIGSSNDWGPETVYKLQRSAREKLVKLLERRRESFEPKNFERPYRWNQVDEEDLLQSQLDETVANCNTLLNLLKGIAISEEDKEEEEGEEAKMEYKRKHAEWLEKQANREDGRKQPILCEFCNVICDNPRELAMHLHTRLHRTKITEVLDF